MVKINFIPKWCLKPLTSECRWKCYKESFFLFANAWGLGWDSINCQMPGPQDSLCVHIKCVGFICQGEWGRGGMLLAGIGSHTII